MTSTRRNEWNLGSVACALAALCALGVAAPAAANFVIEPTFEQKIAESELVLIGTVTAASRGGRGGLGSTATLSVLRTLKGENRDIVVVRTYHPVDELNPRCCEVGATYLMFLRSWGQDGQFESIRGIYGMVRIGGPERHIVVLPAR
jgi:hypothetical protein